MRTLVLLTIWGLFSCQDQLELDPSYLNYESPTLHILNGTGIYYDTINLSRQESYTAQLGFNLGTLPDNVQPVIYGDGSFHFSETYIDGNTIHLSASIVRPGMYTFKYYWLQEEVNCNRILGDIVLVRLIAVEEEVQRF